MKKTKLLQIPYGTKDILPGEARIKRALEDKIAAIFETWGYDEVATPTFEFLDTFATGSGDVSEESIKFFDRNNKTLVLRSDMTTPLARMVATRLNDGNAVKRLSYIANIFRYEQTQTGRQCEFSQAGVELMGAAEPAADAEVLALAIITIKQAGLENFTVSLGHTDFLAGLLEAAALREEDAERIKALVLRHDAVGLEELLTALVMPEALRSLFKRLIFLHGGETLLKELLATVQNEKSVRALRNLAAIFSLAKEYGVENYIRFDLSLIRNFDYYTGMVFEIYTPKMGFPICGGGRYDTMMKAFGRDCPATGFALGIDRLLLVLERMQKAGTVSDWDYFVAWRGQDSLRSAIKRVMELRGLGSTVKLAVAALSLEEAKEELRKNNCRLLDYVE